MNSHSRAFDSITDTMTTLHVSHTIQRGTKSRILSMFLLVSSANQHPPLFLDVPISAARCLYARNDARDPSSERWNCVDENYPAILPKWRLPRHLGIFYMPQIYNIGQTALLPLWRKACWGFFCPEKSWQLRPGLNPRTWVLKGSTLPLDHRSCYTTHNCSTLICHHLLRSVIGLARQHIITSSVFQLGASSH
jgi:hypothetical protein